MGRLALCAWLLSASGLAAAALPKDTPALRSLLEASGAQAAPAVPAPQRRPAADSTADADSRRRYECQAGPHGRGLSSLLALALIQACRSCAASSEPCRFVCHEVIAEQRLPTPVSRGYCN